MYKKDIKPALDTTLSLMGLLLFSWLYLLIIVAIEIDDPGPVFSSKSASEFISGISISISSAV